MAIVPQTQLFTCDQIGTSSDLDRLHMTLGSMPDETLMRALEREHKGRRDDYPIRPAWNSVIAGIVFDPESYQNRPRSASS